MRLSRLFAALAALLLLAVLPTHVSAGTSADLATTMSGCCGSYTVTVTNYGPAAAQNLVVTDSYIPARFLSVTGLFGVACTTPAVGGYAPIVCTTGSLASNAVVKVTMNLQPLCVGGHNQLLSNSATASATNASTSNARVVGRCP
jgi:uncharacterized repeat protein (TIGR01451 family)